LLGRLIHAQERQRATRDTNRLVRPFEWGTEFIQEHANGDDPRRVFEEHASQVLAHSEEFYALPPVSDYKLTDDLLTWTSAVHTPTAENNTARARFFPAQEKRPRTPDKRSTRTRRNSASREPKDDRARRAVVVLPQWNADSQSHVALCRILNRLGIAALRLTLPYHEARRPPGLERADHLVSPNVGRSIQSMRQAVLDTRAAVQWLTQQGYERIGIAGTSIGSCVAFLAFAHEPQIKMGVFNHVSGYVADVVWHGISTQHVRAGFGDSLSLEELRRMWLPISPMPFARRLLRDTTARPMRFIAARYDLTFPRNLSREVIEAVRQLNVPLDVSWLPCGHYTSGERPWIYLDGWKIVTFLRKHL
jgi:dienelactone hydrolase